MTADEGAYEPCLPLPSPKTVMRAIPSQKLGHCSWALARPWRFWPRSGYERRSCKELVACATRAQKRSFCLHVTLHQKRRRIAREFGWLRAQTGPGSSHVRHPGPEAAKPTILWESVAFRHWNGFRAQKRPCASVCERYLGAEAQLPHGQCPGSKNSYGFTSPPWPP